MLMAFGCGNDPGPTASTINPMRRGVGQLANTRWRSIPKNRISSAIENTFIMRFICAWRVRFEQRNLLSVSPSANSNLIHTAIWIIQCHLWYRKRITLPTGMRFQYRAVWCRRITTTKNKYNSCSGPEECAVISSSPQQIEFMIVEENCVFAQYGWQSTGLTLLARSTAEHYQNIRNIAIWKDENKTHMTFGRECCLPAAKIAISTKTAPRQRTPAFAMCVCVRLRCVTGQMTNQKCNTIIDELNSNIPLAAMLNWHIMECGWEKGGRRR